MPILTDVHSAEEIRQIGKAVDILQLPAFLTRQTDFVVAAGESGCAINVKKRSLPHRGMSHMWLKKLNPPAIKGFY